MSYRYDTLAITPVSPMTKLPARSPFRLTRPRRSIRPSRERTKASATRALTIWSRVARARREPCRPRGRAIRGRVCQRDVGHSRNAFAAECRRPRRLHSGSLRRGLAHLHQVLLEIRRGVHVRRHHRSRRRSRRHPPGDEVPLAGDAFEFSAKIDGHRRLRRDRTPRRSPHGRRQHLRHAAAPASHRARRRHRRPLHDEVHQRPQRRSRRRGHHRRRVTQWRS